LDQEREQPYWGTTWWIGFSPDRKQKYMYVADGGDEQVKDNRPPTGETRMGIFMCRERRSNAPGVEAV
jgi:hypothetical protein